MHDKSLSITPNSVQCDAITLTDMNIENVTFSIFIQGSIRITWEPSPETWFQSWEIQHRWLSYYFASPLNAVHVLFMCVSLHFTQPSTYSQHLIFVWPFATQSTPLTWICFNWSQDQWKGWKLVSVSQYLKAAAPLYVYIVYIVYIVYTQ